MATETVRGVNPAGRDSELLAAATTALAEAQAMSEAIGMLVDQLISESFGDAALYVRLQAIKACLLRNDTAIDPAMQALCTHHVA